MSPEIVAVVVIATVALALAGIWRWRHPDWTGFRGRTLWDWISLLEVPVMVGLAGALINAGQQQIAADRAAEEALQAYVDRVTVLVLDPHEGATPETVNAIGRAHTLAILRLVEGERAGRVLAFLAEMDLLRRFSISFEGVDLSGAELKGIAFTGLDFEGASLGGADLENADFTGADFEAADLARADLKGAVLTGASFEAADLSGASLSGADFTGADLSAAIGLTERQLAKACIDETTRLPNAFAPANSRSEGCFTGVVDDD